jgi:hypothetical protein
MVIIRIIGIIAIVAALGAYIQLGLFLTTYRTPIWWMYGLGQWFAWLAIPPAIVLAIAWSEWTN